MTTKAQERKALEQIRKIVESLGEQSYIGTALEGCLEDADQNIEYDAAFSMKSRWETAEQEKNGLENKLRNVDVTNERLTEQVKRLEESSMKPELVLTLDIDYGNQLADTKRALDVAGQEMIEMVGIVRADDLTFIKAMERVAMLKRKIAHIESVKAQLDAHTK